MRKQLFYLAVLFFIACFAGIAATFGADQQQDATMKSKQHRTLTPEEQRVIIHKGTERPFTGQYLNNKEQGIYTCKQCGAALYKSEDKFDSHCGWPSFDDEIPGAVTRIPDPDGMRTEIVCSNCNAHLGHVFLGERFTDKNTRHCVNSISMNFIKPDTAYFASGCFWGTEYYFNKAKGVMETTVGFMGGHVDNPSYKDVCTKTTGHIETTEVVYNPDETSYEELVKLFFETHDFTQKDGQGPDIGPQYISVIFVKDDKQKAIAEKYINLLREKGYDVATQVRKAEPFWSAEAYHQDYYDHKGTTPYCHSYKKIFD